MTIPNWNIVSTQITLIFLDYRTILLYLFIYLVIYVGMYIILRRTLFWKTGFANRKYFDRLSHFLRRGLVLRKANVVITKRCLYNFDPLKPSFYIVKWGLHGYTLCFLFLLENIDCGYSLEPPHRGDSNEYPKSMFWAEIWKISEFFYLIFFIFLVVKFSVYLNRRVFVMSKHC